MKNRFSKKHAIISGAILGCVIICASVLAGTKKEYINENDTAYVEAEDTYEADNNKDIYKEQIHPVTMKEKSSSESKDDEAEVTEDPVEESEVSVETKEVSQAAEEDGRTVYKDAYGNVLSGEWRYEGNYYVFDSEGHIMAGGGSYGSKGRLYIPSVGIDVAVNRSNYADAQYYTDLEDSAAYVDYSQGKYYIADHNTQGFSGLSSVNAGDTAYLFTGVGIELYTCTASFSGHNTGTSLVDGSGNDIVGIMPSNGFTTYTCQNDWTNIQIAFWERKWIASTSSSEQTVKLERRAATGNIDAPTGESAFSDAPVLFMEMQPQQQNEQIIMQPQQQDEQIIMQDVPREEVFPNERQADINTGERFNSNERVFFEQRNTDTWQMQQDRFRMERNDPGMNAL